MKSTVHSRSGQDALSKDVSKDVMNVDDALRRLGDDKELLRDIIQIYLEDAPGIVEKIHNALDQADTNALQRAAHSLKGLAATLSASEFVGAAARVEYLAATRNLSEAPKAVAEVDQHVSDLNAAVQQILRRK
jgi:two-component system, sensor histidine kinase and response regulator